MGWFTHLVKSSVGAKAVMAITGIAMVLFALAHMLGHLLIFKGQDSYNDYAQGLADLGPILWVARIGLIGVFAAHIVSAISVSKRSVGARPVKYEYVQRQVTSYSARTMRISGMILFLFIGYHLAHFTFRWVTPEYQEFVEPIRSAVESQVQYRADVFSMMVHSFENPAIVGIYLAAVGLLSWHLAHGIPSFFQTLGMRHPKYQPVLNASGPIIGGLLFVGYAAVPISILAGCISA